MDEKEEKWCLTIWGCMKATLEEYGINTDHLTPKMGEHMVNDFMGLLCRQGIVEEKKNGANVQNL